MKPGAWICNDQVDHVIHASGLIDFFRKDKGEKGETRVENLLELVSAAKSFEPDPAEEMAPLDEFLSHAALEAGEGQADAWEDCVQLMTMHSAKGLEFPLVFLCGMEDGLFPHQRSIADPNGLEEERRLCYVGITRAKQTLYITHAEQRRLHGMDNFSQPSRFIAEIPGEHVEEIRPRVQVSRPMRPAPSSRRRQPSINGRDGDRHAPRPASAPQEVWRRRDTELRRAGNPRARGGEFRDDRYKMAGAQLCEPGKGLINCREPYFRSDVDYR